MCLIRCAILILLWAAVIPIYASGASFDVDQIQVSGPEDVFPEDLIRVSARVSFDPSGRVTFPGGDTLQLSTDLGDPVWKYTLIVDNRPVQTFSREAASVFINGYYLEYSQGRSEYLSLQVSGTVPDEVVDGVIQALTVTQFDVYGSVRGNGISTIPVAVHIDTELPSPEPVRAPESAAPMPTTVPLNGIIILMGLAFALAAILYGKKRTNMSVR